MRESGMSVLLVVVCFVLVAGTAPLVASPSHSGTTGTGELTDVTPDQTTFGVDIDADSTHLRADVRENGDADWRVTYRLVLDDDDEIQAFEELQDDIDDGPDAYLDPFEERIRDLAESAEQTTGREMGIRNVSIETEHQRQPQADIGRVTYSFEWSGFAAAEDDELRAGDAVDRLFLDVDEDLTIAWPADYRLGSHQPEGQLGEDRVTWQGRIEFDTGEPRVVVTTGDPGETDDVGDPDEDDDPGEDDGDADGGLVSPLLAGLIGLGIVLAVAATALVFRRQASEESPLARNERDDGGQPDEATDESDTPSSQELLSPEERVLELVEANGGRMKQKQVTEELDWSAARTSQVVGKLREAGTLESFRLGRENVLTLPDTDIDGGPTRASEDVDHGGSDGED